MLCFVLGAGDLCCLDERQDVSKRIKGGGDVWRLLKPIPLLFGINNIFREPLINVILSEAEESYVIRVGDK